MYNVENNVEKLMSEATKLAVDLNAKIDSVECKIEGDELMHILIVMKTARDTLIEELVFQSTSSLGIAETCEVPKYMVKHLESLPTRDKYTINVCDLSMSRLMVIAVSVIGMLREIKGETWDDVGIHEDTLSGLFADAKALLAKLYEVFELLKNERELGTLSDDTIANIGKLTDDFIDMDTANKIFGNKSTGFEEKYSEDFFNLALDVSEVLKQNPTNINNMSCEQKQYILWLTMSAGMFLNKCVKIASTVYSEELDKAEREENAFYSHAAILVSSELSA